MRSFIAPGHGVTPVQLLNSCGRLAQQRLLSPRSSIENSPASEVIRLQYVGLTKGTDSRRGQSVTLSRHPPARGTKSGHFGHYVARAGVSDVTDRCICLTWKGLAIPRSAPHLHCKWCGFVILGPQGIKSVMKEVHNLLLLGFSFLSIALLLRRNFSAGRK